jgi:hypothetical protein
MFDNDNFIEVPFEHRHQCWFCAEPAASHFSFPHQHHLVFDCPHPTLTVPSCTECVSAALKANVRNIWQVEQQVKKFLIRKYKKDLAIGLNWTQDELANAGFEDGSFSGFQKSAWFMYEVAKERVSFRGWRIVVDGIEIEQDSGDGHFHFDGVYYPSVEDAIEHYSENFRLDRIFFRQVLAKIGLEKFSQAVRVCRLFVGASAEEKVHALRDL